jgi:dsRNA-specific ribonuclease
VLTHGFVLDEQGPDHDKCFKVAADVNGHRFPPAWGRNKKEAEINAATEALRERRWKEKQDREEVVKNSEEL